MKITSVELRNFLSFGNKSQKLVFDNLNTIVGPNDVGKTNVFRAISFVYNYFKEFTVKPGIFYHNIDLTKVFELRIGLSFSPEEKKALSNFLFCSSLIEPPNIHSPEDRDLAMELIEDFIKTNTEKISNKLFENVTVIIRNIQGRPIYKADHLIQLGNSNQPLLLHGYGIFSKTISRRRGPSRISDVILDFLREKDPKKVENYIEVSKKPKKISKIKYNKEQISNFIFDVIFDKKAKDVEFRGFRFDDGWLRDKNFPQELELRGFLSNRGYTEENLSIIDLIGTIFTSSVVKISDIRGKPRAYLNADQNLESSSESLHYLSGENLPQILFQLRNSTSPSMNKRYNEILKSFKEISNNTEFDIAIRSHTFKEKKGIALVPLEDISQSTRIDKAVPAGLLQDEEEKVQNELVLRFVRGDLSIPLEFAAAGRFESLLLLTALIGHSNKIILLDEPASNLHPILQKKLLEIIENSVSDNYNQVIMITHSPYLINPEQLENLWRITQKQGKSEVINIKESVANLDDKEEKRMITQFWNSDIRSILFAKGVILVEGPSDKIVIEKIDKHLSINGKGANLEDEDWLVIDIGGKNSLSSFIKLTKLLHLPYVAVVDNDALMRCENNLKTSKYNIKTSSIPITLYNCGMINGDYVDKIKKIEKSIYPVTPYEKKKVKQFWYPEKQRLLLNKIANLHNIFVFSKDLENALQTPITKKQSKPLKDFEVVMEKIQQNKIPTEFYSMVEFMKNTMNHKK